MIQQVHITVGYFFAVHIFQAVYQQAAVDADKIRFGEFAYQCGDILVLHIGVGIVFAAGSRIGSVAIIEKKFELVPYFPVFQMFLAIQHICLGNAVIMLCHQSYFHLILDFFHTGSITDTDTAQYIGNDILCSKTPY